MLLLDSQWTELFNYPQSTIYSFVKGFQTCPLATNGKPINAEQLPMHLALTSVLALNQNLIVILCIKHWLLYCSHSCLNTVNDWFILYAGADSSNAADEYAVRTSILVSAQHLRKVHPWLLQRRHGGHPTGRRHPLRPPQEVVARHPPAHQVFILLKNSLPWILWQNKPQRLSLWLDRELDQSYILKVFPFDWCI